MIKITNVERFKQWMRYEFCDVVSEETGRDVKIPEVMGEWEGALGYYFNENDYREAVEEVTGNANSRFSEVLEEIVKRVNEAEGHFPKKRIDLPPVLFENMCSLIWWARANNVDCGAVVIGPGEEGYKHD